MSTTLASVDKSHISVLLEQCDGERTVPAREDTDGSASINPESSNVKTAFSKKTGPLKFKHCLSSWSLTLFLPCSSFAFNKSGHTVLW